MLCEAFFNNQSGSISDQRDQAQPHNDTAIEDITLSEEEIIANFIIINFITINHFKNS